MKNKRYGAMVWCALGAEFLTAVIAYVLLPDQIAVQWSGTEASQYGSKAFLFLMPLIAWFLCTVGRPCVAAVIGAVSDPVWLTVCLIINAAAFTLEWYMILYTCGLRIPIAAVLIAEALAAVVAVLASFWRKNRNRA